MNIFYSSNIIIFITNNFNRQIDIYKDRKETKKENKNKIRN